MNKRIWCMVLCAFLIIAGCALGEQAKVKTPSGPLNMRAEPDTRAKLLDRVPNKATVTYDGKVDDAWSKITYRGRTGYVQTIYLNLTKTAEGKDVYPDANGPVHVREKASDSGKIIATIAQVNPLSVIEVKDDWTKVSCMDADGKTVTGYVLTERIADQYTEPQITHIALNEQGILSSKQTIYFAPSKSAEKIATLPKGQMVNVQYIEGSWCYVTVDSVISGYLSANTLQLTGKQAETPENPLLTYTATYYLCTVPSGVLPVYVEPTGDLKGELRETIPVDPKEALPVVKHAYASHGAKWAQVIYNGHVYWTPSASIKVGSETAQMHYSTPVKSFTGATVYAKKDAKLYAEGTTFSKVLATIPKGTEMEGSLGEGYIAVTYKGQTGYVMYSDVVCGFAQYVNLDEDWAYWEHLNDPAPTSTPAPVPMEHIDDNIISNSEARAKADTALIAAYGAKDLDKMQVNGDKGLYARGSDPVYEFAYFKNGKYMFNARIDARTGKTVSTADYRDFAQSVSFATKTPKPTEKPIAGELSASQARSTADAKLRATYGSFDDYAYHVVNERFVKMPGYDEPVFRLNYFPADTEGDFGFTCIVGAKSGSVLYHTDMLLGENTEIDYSTPTPAPQYESTVDIGEAAARRIAESNLAGKYPEFSNETFRNVNVRRVSEGGSWETPYYSFDFMVTDGHSYTCVVHAYTQKILYSDGSLPGEGNG